MRFGAKKRPFYRVVVADQRSPRDGRFIENIGKYHPLEDPSLVEIDEQRALHWLRTGAQPSAQVINLLTIAGVWEKFVAERPSAAKLKKTKPGEAKPAKAKASKKAAARSATPDVAPMAEVPAVQDAAAEGPAVESPVPETPSETPAEDAPAEP